MRVFKVSGLSHEFVGKSIFNNAELTVNDGRPNGIPDHIGLVGPNGCGKSTFLKMIVGTVVPDQLTKRSSTGSAKRSTACCPVSAFRTPTGRKPRRSFPAG